MSSRKRPLSEITPNAPTSKHRELTTPFATRTNRSDAGRKSRSAHSTRRVNALQPGSARNILRRLAKITAPTTRRRTVTPTSISRDKENRAPLESSDDEQDLKKPRLAFDLEESIEEEDSEVLVAPTPSALLEDLSDEDEEPPTITFLEGKAAYGNVRSVEANAQVPLHPQSDTIIHNEQSPSEDDEGYSTFLTERGRRAVSEEPTRMSRYSFGSIRMSDFGSELEIRRESDRQKERTDTESQKEYAHNGQVFESYNIQLDGETENLRNLRRSTSVASEQLEASLHMPGIVNDTFQLEIPDVPEVLDNEDVVASHRNVSGKALNPADSFLEIDGISNADQAREVERIPRSATKTRRQTLLESMAAVSKPRSRKKLKMNRKGNMVPMLPSRLIKHIVNESQERAGKRKIALGKDHMKALEQATEWYFEQISEDLEAFANHSKRKKRIDSADVLLLMRRQRILRGRGELREMAKEWLPREIWAKLDLPD